MREKRNSALKMESQDKELDGLSEYFFGYGKGQNCKISKVTITLLPDVLENSHIKP